MNSKAQKTSLQMPPLLSLAHNEFAIDNTLANVEELNAPFLNKKIQPLYRKDYNEEYHFDKAGNKYQVVNNHLTRNGINLFRVAPRKFIKEDVTERFQQYLAFDIDDSNREAYATFDYDNNMVTLHYGTEATSSQLFYEGQVIEGRIRIIDNVAWLVLIYRNNTNQQQCYIMSLEYNGQTFKHWNQMITWYKQKIRNTSSASYTATSVTKESIYPLIQIAKVYNDIIGISLVAEYSIVLNSYDKAAFATYFIDNDTLYDYGNSLKPNTSTTPKQVTTTVSAYFKPTITNSYTQDTGYVVYQNGSYYDYDEHGPTTLHLFPAGYTPPVSGQIDLDGTIYTQCQWRKYIGQSVVDVVCNDDNISYTIRVNGTTSGTHSVTLTKENYKGVEYPDVNKIEVYWNSSYTEIPLSYINKNFLIERTTTSITNISFLAYPNVVLDNGNMYCMFCFDNITSAFTNTNGLQQGAYIVESGKVTNTSVASYVMTYTITSLEEVSISSNGNHVRSNSYSVGQNFFQSTVKLNNNSAAAPNNVYAGTSEDTDTARYIEYSNSNGYDLTYYPGTNRLSDFNYYSKETKGPGEDLAVFTSIGVRTKLNDHFGLLFNTFISGYSTIQGISYTDTPEAMGTLLTEWQSIDEDFYVCGNDTCVFYRDRNHKYYKISIVEGNEIYSFLDDRFIVVNTTSYWNCYDTVKNKKFHYANDYNDRAVGGVVSLSYVDIASYYKVNGRLRISAINASYRNVPRDSITSEILLQNTVLRGAFDEKVFRVYNSECPEDNDTQGIDVYYSMKNNTTSNKYRYSLYSFSGVTTSHQDFDKIGTTYVVNSSNLVSPNIFSKYVNGAGNNDMIVEDMSCYALSYYQEQPFFNYSVATELDNVQHFFVLQGQFYAIINDKIYSIIYTDGVITEMEAIIDIRGFQFLGNTPTIAFFWSPSIKGFYSFTGDASLEFLYDGNKFTTISSKCYYDESTQSIFIPSDRGCLVFGPKNSFILEDLTNISNIQFTEDGITHINSNNKTIDFVYYPADDFVSNKVKLETQFYGSGDTNTISIDKWDIIVQAEDITKPCKVKVGVRTLTDVSVKSEEKVLEIKPTDWDKWSRCALIAYNPQLIKGQGVRLYIESECSIASITPHVMNTANGTLTKHNV